MEANFLTNKKESWTKAIEKWKQLGPISVAEVMKTLKDNNVKYDPKTPISQERYTTWNLNREIVKLPSGR